MSNEKWEYWMTLYLDMHCTARGLCPSTIAAYSATLAGFRVYVSPTSATWLMRQRNYSGC